MSASNHQPKPSKSALGSIIININNPNEKKPLQYKLQLDSQGTYGPQTSNNVVHNGKENINIWRYDFKEKGAQDNKELYVTLLVEPQFSDSKASVETRLFLFIRKGSPVSLVTHITTMIPGLNFPVGGITLIPPKKAATDKNTKPKDEDTDKDAKENPEVVIGNVNYLTDAMPICDSYRDTIATKIITNKVQCNGCILGWDLAFAWQSPSASKIPTRNFNYEDKNSRITEQGFFATVSSRSSNGSDILSRHTLSEGADAWVLSWSANGTTNSSIKLGPDAKQPIATGKNFRVEGFLSGLMASNAAATWFAAKDTDNIVLNGTKLPLIARSDTADMPGQFSQLFIVGRTFLVNEDEEDELTDNANKSDQLLSKDLCLGTTIDFLAHLPRK